MNRCLAASASCLLVNGPTEVGEAAALLVVRPETINVSRKVLMFTKKPFSLSSIVATRTCFDPGMNFPEMDGAVNINPACLADARCVLAAQDPNVSQLAERWPVAQWRAAVKAAAQEIEHEHHCL